MNKSQTFHTVPTHYKPVLGTLRRTKFVLLVAVILIVLSGCASWSTPPPTAAIQAAELAIADTDQARIADYASLELSEARDKLNSARMAVQDDNMALALRLAQESTAEAELASAKADVVKAQEVNDLLKSNIETMKQEMQRRSGGSK